MNTFKKLLLATVLMASLAFGQTALSTTTLGAAVTTTNGIPATTITVASTSTMQNAGTQNQPNTVLYCDRELIYVTTVVNATTLTVQRGKGVGAGGVVTDHNSGTLCYFANTANRNAAPMFFSSQQTNAEVVGRCLRSQQLALPRIYVFSGDVYDCKQTGAAGTYGQWIKVGNGSSAGAGQQLSFFCTGTVGSNENAYLNGAACSGATTSTYRYTVQSAGTLANLRVWGSAAVVAGGSDPVTVYVNGSATAVTCTIAAAATTCSDTTHSVAVAAGDRISILFDSTASDSFANPSVTVGLY